MKKNIFVLFLFLSLLVIIPVTSLLVTDRSQDTRSKAAEDKMLPVLPPLSPFIRVGKATDRVKKGELIPVYISAKSNELGIVEAQISLSYDPTQFILDEKNVRNENVFPTLSLSSLEAGKVVFSLFGNTETGFAPVQLVDEKTIATLFFTVTGETGDGSIRLLREGDEKTALYAGRDPDTGEAPDVLSATQDVIIHID